MHSSPIACALLCAALAAACASTAASRNGPAESAPPAALTEALAEPEAAADAPPMRPVRKLDDDGVFYVLSEDATHPRVRYLDGQLSRNDKCGVQLGNKLNRRVPPVYVNGQPIGFC